MKMSKKLFPVVFMWALSACQGGDPVKRQSDPLASSQYRSILNDRALNQSVSTIQNMVGSVADILVDGNPGEDTLQFHERQSSKYELVARVAEPGVESFLKFPRLPNGMSISQLGEKYIMTWTPAVGTIPKGLKSWSQDIPIEIALGSRTTARARENLARYKTNLVKIFKVQVHFPEDQPSLMVKGLENSKLKRTDVVKFTVQVSDPLTMKAREPIVYALFDWKNISQELPRFNAVRGVTTDYEVNKGQPTFQNGVWTFHFLLDMTLISEKALKEKKFVGGAFLLQAVVPATGHVSEKYPIEFDLVKE